MAPTRQPLSEVHNLAELVAYEEGRVVSRTSAQNSSLSLTLFAFDEGEGVSTHTAPGDAIFNCYGTILLMELE